jgi:hypothetical protein
MTLPPEIGPVCSYAFRPSCEEEGAVSKKRYRPEEAEHPNEDFRRVIPLRSGWIDQVGQVTHFPFF